MRGNGMNPKMQGRGVIFGTLIGPERLQPGGALAFSGGRIAWVGPEEELPAEWRDVPAVRAEYVGPGFVDLHLHGRGGCDVMSGEPEDLRRIARLLAAQGTTAFLPTTMSAGPEELEAVARAVRAARRTQVGPGAGKDEGAEPLAEAETEAGAELEAEAELLGFHLEGPYLNSAKAGAQATRTLRPLDLGEIDRLQELSGGLLRLITLAPELTPPQALAEVRARGIRLSAGHSQATYDEALKAFRAGVDQGTHLFNAMPPLNHREPGLAGALLTAEGVVAQLILDFVHVHPAAARIAVRAKGVEGVALITDSLPHAGLPPGQYPWDGRTVVVRPEALYLDDGTLAGSNLTLLDAVRHALKLGCSLPEAWRMASLTPAQAMGIEERKGRLAAGCDADLVLLDQDLSLSTVYCGGRALSPGPG